MNTKAFGRLISGSRSGPGAGFRWIDWVDSFRMRRDPGLNRQRIPRYAHTMLTRQILELPRTGLPGRLLGGKGISQQETRVVSRRPATGIYRSV